MSIPKPPLGRIAVNQLIMLAVLCLAASLWSALFAISLLAGGLVNIVANLYFGRFAFRYQGANKAANIVYSMYTGLTLKLVLTALLFTAFFVAIEHLNVLAVFVGYGVMALGHVLAAARHL